MLYPKGHRLGDATILEVVEERAFVATYRAEQSEIGRTVWVRALGPTVPERSPYAAALEREAAILARLEHDAFPRLYGFEKRGATAWMVLEDVRGATMTELLRAGAAGDDAAIAIGIELGRALGVAHAKKVALGVLLRDGMRVTPGGGIKIVDLRCAVVEDSSDVSAVEAVDLPSRADAIAPELLEGARPGPQSDVFALGALVYELAAGDRPLGAKDGPDLARLLRSGRVASLSARLPDAPRALDRVLGRALARDPLDRFADGAAFAEALAEVLAARSSGPSRDPVVRALARAKLEAEPANQSIPAAPRHSGDERAWLKTTAIYLAGVFALIVLGAIVSVAARDDDSESSRHGSSEGARSAKASGLLRVVVHPWAEVYVDGEHVETTPVARPILLSPGRHYVTFRHPTAPEEQRTIRIQAGENLLLDVTMRIARPVDAGVIDAGEATP